MNGDGDPEEFVPPRSTETDARADSPAMPRPGETEAEAAARVASEAGQDPWGEPEDQPDHRDNTVFEQQQATSSRRPPGVAPIARHAHRTLTGLQRKWMLKGVRGAIIGSEMAVRAGFTGLRWGLSVIEQRDPSGCGTRPAIDHVTVGVSDLAASRMFYRAALAPLGFVEAGPSQAGPDEITFGPRGRADFAISRDYRAGAPVHVAFRAQSRAQVDAFHAAALAAGGVDHGAPGLRPQYSPTYYGAFVLDRDGHNIEAVFRTGN